MNLDAILATPPILVRKDLWTIGDVARRYTSIEWPSYSSKDLEDTLHRTWLRVPPACVYGWAAPRTGKWHIFNTTAGRSATVLVDWTYHRGPRKQHPDPHEFHQQPQDVQSRLLKRISDSLIHLYIFDHTCDRALAPR